jgi:hypothetical protein
VAIRKLCACTALFSCPKQHAVPIAIRGTVLKPRSCGSVHGATLRNKRQSAQLKKTYVDSTSECAAPNGSSVKGKDVEVLR